jgi:hypothetical protein
MAKSIPPTVRPLNGRIRPATAATTSGIGIFITVSTANIILANVVVITAVPLA